MKYVVLPAQPQAVRTCDDYGDGLLLPTVVDGGDVPVDTGLLNKDGVKLYRVREREFGFRVRR